MTDKFAPLHADLLAAGTTYVRHGDEPAHRVTLESPALEVMTDLTEVQAVTVGPNVQIDAALERMKHSGVRLLFVGNAQHELLGIITARDIQGERPLKFQNGLQWKVDLAEDSYSWLCLIWFPVTLHDSIRTVSPGCEPCLSSHSSACFHIALAAQLCLFV